MRLPGLFSKHIQKIGRALAKRRRLAMYNRSMTEHRIYRMSFSSVYPLYIKKAEKKGRTKAEVDHVIRWLTGYDQKELDRILEKNVIFSDFFKHAPLLNPSRKLITGLICGVRVEEIQDPLMQEIRYLDKLIDELAKGRSLDKIFRKA